MKTVVKGKLGCVLLFSSVALSFLGGVLMMGSSHPAPGTPPNNVQFGIGAVTTLLAVVVFFLGLFYGLVAVAEWVVYGRRRALAPPSDLFMNDLSVTTAPVRSEDELHH